MRIHVVNVMRAATGETGRTLDRFAGFARDVERKGFAGLWMTDSFGRGRATLDPLVLMGVTAAVTDKIEIGTCVLQVPVRHPIELAHRLQSLHALAGERLQLGLGSGSTKADFDLVGLDYEARFKTLMSSLEIMRRAWRGEPLALDTGEVGALTPWPGTEGGPAILLGAWRNKRWILPPVHPGEILREDLLKPLGISINRLGRDLRVPVTRVSEIVNGRRGVTADTALRLARYFGTTPELWMSLQSAYDLDSAQRLLAGRIARDVNPREAA